METNLDTLKMFDSKHILTNQNLLDIRGYISRKYPNYSHTQNAQIFANTVNQIIDNNLVVFSTKNRKKLKKQIYVNAAEKNDFEISAKDVVSACIELYSSDNNVLDEFEKFSESFIGKRISKEFLFDSFLMKNQDEKINNTEESKDVSDENIEIIEAEINDIEIIEAEIDDLGLDILFEKKEDTYIGSKKVDKEISIITEVAKENNIQNSEIDFKENTNFVLFELKDQSFSKYVNENFEVEIKILEPNYEYFNFKDEGVGTFEIDNFVKGEKKKRINLKGKISNIKTNINNIKTNINIWFYYKGYIRLIKIYKLLKYILYVVKSINYKLTGSNALNLFTTILKLKILKIGALAIVLSIITPHLYILATSINLEIKNIKTNRASYEIEQGYNIEKAGRAIHMKDINSTIFEMSNKSKNHNTIDISKEQEIGFDKLINIVTSDMDILVTAYDLSTESNGRTKDNWSYGQTDLGTKATKERTIAVNPEVIPLGSKVLLKFDEEDSYLNGIYVAESVGRFSSNNIIDLFLGEDKDDQNTVLNEVRNFGMKKAKVYILDNKVF